MAKRGKSRNPGLGAQAAALLKDLSGDLAEAERGAPVHGARRRIKRLRSYIRLVRPVVGEEAYRAAGTQLKAAADALSGLRRHEALHSAAARLGEDLPEAELLAGMVARHHAAQAKAMPPADSLASARQALAAAQAMMAGWRLTADDLAKVEDAFLATYRKARKDLRAALGGKDAEALHEARKHVIHHMHHLELLAHGTQAKRIAELDQLRDLLGDFNDLVELEHLTVAAVPEPERRVLKAMHGRRKALLAKARKGWEPLFGQKTAAFAKHMAPIREGLMP